MDCPSWKIVLLTGKPNHQTLHTKWFHSVLIRPHGNDLKCKLQEVYSMVATEYHEATDLLRKQRPSESLQDYFAYWMEMCHHSMKVDPSAINNKLVIILFVKNMYNKEICRRVAGVKNINTPLGMWEAWVWIPPGATLFLGKTGCLEYL